MNVSLTGPWSRRLALALFGIGLMTAAVAAQSGRPPRGPARRAATPQPTPNVAPASATRAAGQPGRPAIDAIYQAATQAATVGEIQQALDRCDQLGAQPLAAEDLEYLQQLQAWLLEPAWRGVRDGRRTLGRSWLVRRSDPLGTAGRGRLRTLHSSSIPIGGPFTTAA